jgi:mono/diheme cytochrome c family protein
MKMFVIGLLIGFFILFPLVIYLYVKLGFLSLATTANPLPMEKFLAKTALNESVGNAKNDADPLPLNDDNLLAGAKEYREHCAVCHGVPGQPKTKIAAGMFPVPPQLFEGHGVTDDPEGETHWKIVHGIRLSGMPGFDKTLPDNERWQITMLLKHADKLPATVQASLREGPVPSH